MALEFTHQDDTPLVGIGLVAERTVPSAHVLLKVKNVGVDPVVGAFVTMYAETAPGSAIFVTNGQPVVDERMGRFEITGQDSVATPGQQVVLGVVQSLGHLAVAFLPKILPGDWILAEFWLEQAGSSAGGGAVSIKLELANDRAAYPLPLGTSSVGTGIDSQRKQRRSFLVSGRNTVATGTPDNQVHTKPGSWLIEGEEYADGLPGPFDEDTTFDQNDSALAALAAGESYIAVLTQGAAGIPQVTKGLKAIGPVKPTPPAGELILAWITVHYHAVASVIAPADIEEDITYGRYLVVAPATGLTVTVHAGEAVIADFYQVRAQKGPLVLPPSQTNRVWLEWNGALTVTTSDIPPSGGAVKLAQVVTGGANVTSLTDTRRYINRAPGGALEVKTVGGSPDIASVSYIVLPNGSLTDDGFGGAVVDFPTLTGKADAATGLTASEGVKRVAGTDLSTAALIELDVIGLATDPSPDLENDAVATYDNSASAHKLVILKNLGGHDRKLDFAGNGVSQPATLSPVPLTTCIPLVFVDGLYARPGGGLEYTDDGAGNIVFTPVLGVGQKASIRWRSA